MDPWLALAVSGGGVALIAVLLLIWRWRSLPKGPGYIAVPAAQEPVDPLLRSQLSASLSETATPRGHPLENLRNWATGTSDLAAEINDFQRQMRTLQTYVLDLDARYIRREESAWLSLQIAALVLGVTTGVSTTVWALIELGKPA
jgi:hypothetical protein